MAVNLSALQNGFASLFADPPATKAACAQAWASAAELYAAAVVPPSTTVAAASSALAAALTAAFESPSGAAPGFDGAFATWAAAIGAGMLPAFVATPPPEPLGVVAQLMASIDTHAAAAASWAEFIDAWFRTGSAELVAPPHTVAAWS
jgi:hypothetical protein